jgi:DNA modification methylase
LKAYYQDSAVTIYHGDCGDLLHEIRFADLLLTDPPYGIDVGNMSMGKGRKASHFSKFDWDKESAEQIDLDFAIQKTNWQIVWGGHHFKMEPTRCLLAWDKIQDFSGSDFELAWTNFDKPSRVFRLSRVEAYGNVPRLHPTEKPLPLIAWCISQSEENKLILDPFMGSGTTLRAAKDLGRKAIGIEIEEKYCEIAARRMEQEVLPLTDASNLSREISDTASLF